MDVIDFDSEVDECQTFEVRSLIYLTLSVTIMLNLNVILVRKKVFCSNIYLLCTSVITFVKSSTGTYLFFKLIEIVKNDPYHRSLWYVYCAKR